MEKRRADIFPDFAPSSLSSLVQQWRFLDAWPCTARELHSIAHFAPFQPVRGGGGGGGAAIGLARKQPAVKDARPDVSAMSVYPPRATAGVAAAVSRSVLPAFLQQLLDALPPTPALAGGLPPFHGARAQELMDSIVDGVPDEMPPYLADISTLRSLKRGLDEYEDSSGSDIYLKRQERSQKMRHTA